MRRRTRTSHLATCALLTAAAVAWSTPSFAYRMLKNNSTGRVTSGFRVLCTDGGGFAHWTKKRTNWYHNTALKGAGKAQALKNSMASWTGVSSANHGYAPNLGLALIPTGYDNQVIAIRIAKPNGD